MVQLLRFKAHHILGLFIIGFFTAVVYRYNLELKGVLLGSWFQYETTEGKIVRVDKGFEIDNRQRRTIAVIEYNYLVNGASYYSTLINFAEYKRHPHFDQVSAWKI